MKSATGSSSGPPRTPLPSFASLTRQPSIYTLTLQELQNAVHEPGKSFGSMNIEDFIKNIWTAEESQAMAAALSNAAEGNGSSSTGSASLPPTSLQRGLSLPRNLTGKTVDEVWKEIHRSSDRNGPGNLGHKQVTMADVTLEDFLARAGFMREEGDLEPSLNSSSSSVVTLHNGIASSAPTDGMQASQVGPHPVEWLNFQLKGNMPHQQLLQHQHLLQQQQQAEAAAGAFMGRLAAPNASRVTPPGAPNVGGVSFDSTGTIGSANVLDASFDSNVGVGLSLTSALAVSERKRPHETLEEKSIEQRQKRMIKNRESAARSRARKQAYNVELQSEVESLKEEKDNLVRQQAERMMRRRKMLIEGLVPVTNQPPRRRWCLRRTQSTEW